MYEENLKPLPPGDATVVFSDEFKAVRRLCGESPEPLGPENVMRWGLKQAQPYVGKICRRLILPGSCIAGLDHLALLADLARRGTACLVCMNHRSNLDVPTLYTLLEDQSESSIFHQIIWIAGRKLHEDSGLTPAMARCFNQVTLTPRSWLNEGHTAEALQKGHEINVAAQRTMRELRHRGWVFALFPTGTRVRPNHASTARAIEETDSYLKHFEVLALGNIDGCTLPVTRDRDLTRETPRLDRLIYTFGPATRTDQWRSNAARRFPQLSQRAASARAIMEDIGALAPRPSQNT